MSSNMTQIFIANEDDTTFSLEVDLNNDDISSVKREIFQITHISSTLQELMFSGVVLENSQILYTCGIEAGGTLNLLRVQEVLEVNVERSTGEIFKFWLDRNETIGSLKRRIAEEKGIAVRKQRMKKYEATVYDFTSISSLLYGDRNKVTIQLEELFNLRLEVFNGVVMHCVLPSNSDVEGIHSAVIQRCRIPYHHQNTYYNGQLMELRHKISEYGVTEGATIQVERRTYETQVYFKTLDGRTVVVTVSSQDTVAQVKEKIGRQENIPVERQRLIFVGEQLDDNTHLLDYRIEHESAVHLIIRTGDGFELSVQVPGGRSFVFEVTSDCTIGYVKQKLREKVALPPEVQELYSGDQILEDEDATLEECGIQRGNNLRLEIDPDKSMQIFISLPNNDSLSLWVNPDYTVQRLKDIIAGKRDIPVDLQELYYARQRLENERTLRSYNIEENHMLHLERVVPPLLHFTVKIPNSEEPPIALEKPANVTVDMVKREIETKIRIPKTCQQLFFSGLELDGDSKLGDCGIIDGSNVDLILVNLDLTDDSETGIHLFIKTLTGKTMTIVIQPTDTVLELKKKIEEKEGLQISHQCLICGGKALGDELTIHNCGVQNQSVLHLVLRLPSQGPLSITVEDGGVSHQIDTTYGSTVGSVKEQLQTMSDIAVASQTLLFEGRVLADEETLGSCDITDGATLQLQH